MTANDVRETVTTAPLPRPRTAADDTVAAEARAEASAEAVAEAPAEAPRVDRLMGGQYPWPEPWHFSRAARPRTEFWDVETASWRSRGPGITSATTD